MSLDMKNNRRPAKPSQGSPLFLGIIIGTLIGVAIAVGVALFLNRNSPFLNQENNASGPKEASSTIINSSIGKQPEILHPDNNQIIDGVPPVDETQAPESSASQPQTIDYDFYKVLPGHAKETGVSSTTTRQLSSSPSQNIKEPIKRSYLQVGAFQNEQQADNLKAKLALLGLEAQIQSKEQGDIIIHRVRIGPFNSPEELSRMRTQLTNNGINSTLVN